MKWITYEHALTIPAPGNRWKTPDQDRLHSIAWINDTKLDLGQQCIQGEYQWQVAICRGVVNGTECDELAASEIDDFSISGECQPSRP